MDEKVVKGLMHDIQNGGLRRRRGQLEMGDWDSDDDDDDADERRRRWELRREEMKRRMLEDENLGKLGTSFMIYVAHGSGESKDTSVFERHFFYDVEFR
jgi:hypothetical protein